MIQVIPIITTTADTITAHRIVGLTAVTMADSMVADLTAALTVEATTSKGETSYDGAQ
jgi:hypothetical protein